MYEYRRAIRSLRTTTVVFSAFCFNEQISYENAASTSLGCFNFQPIRIHPTMKRLRHNNKVAGRC